VAENDGCRTRRKVAETGDQVEPIGPQVVQAHNVKTRSLHDFISQHSNARVGRQVRDPLRDVCLRPPESIIVVAQDAEGATTPQWQVGEHPSGVIQHLRLVAREIPGVNDELRSQFLDSLKAS